MNEQMRKWKGKKKRKECSSSKPRPATLPLSVYTKNHFSLPGIRLEKPESTRNSIWFRTQQQKHGKKRMQIYSGFNFTDQLASVDRISSSAHQRGDSFGVAPSGPIAVISFNLAAISLIVGLSLGSG